MLLVAWLEELDRTSLPLAGGKAANLGEMLRAVLPVPPGFVLTTDAYSLFVTTHCLQPEIERLVQEANPDDSERLETASQAIKGLFDSHAVPEIITSSVRDAYQSLGRPAVAVRSSATAEDLAEASFAGQMESYLHVRGDEALLLAIRRCWASLWTPRAISYRARQRISSSALRLAVVVQQMIDADAAGVLFTANPVTGHRGQMAIDAVLGLGEALVSGQVTPDHWVIDVASRTILEAQLARKDRMTAGGEHSTTLVAVPTERQDRPALDDATIRALIVLGERVASHFGTPQDIEWALRQGTLYLVQSRPITFLFPLPYPQPVDADLRVYVCLNVVQGIVEPFTPMGISLFRCLLNAIATFKYGIKVPRGEAAPAFKVAAGRIFVDVTVPLRHKKARTAFPRLASIVDQHIAEILTTLLTRDTRLGPVAKRLPVKLPIGFAVGVLGRALWVVIAPEMAPSRLVKATQRLARKIEHEMEGIHEPQACRRYIEERLSAYWPQLMYHAMPLIGPGLMARFLAEWLLGSWLNDPTALQLVLRSLPHNPTMEMDLTLWRISRQLKAEGVEPSIQHPAIVAFLAQYGHRAAREIDIGIPRWREEPEHVLNVLRTYLGHADEADPDRQFRQGEQAAEEASRQLVERVRREKGWLRARVMQFLLRRIRALLGRREYPKFLFVRVFAAVRRMISRAGAALVASGQLEREEDVFFVDLNDVDSKGDLRNKVANSTANYNHECQRRIIPRVMTSEGETFYRAPSSVPGALVGTSASPGSYEGKVRVILDPRGARIEPGEILVAPGTDPAWTPLFLSAGALVMELGGIMSHGSVVAREYGIPAVVGVPGATRLLTTGQRVRIDGDSGQVVPL
jgi:pyruvate,water dikinase